MAQQKLERDAVEHHVCQVAGVGVYRRQIGPTTCSKRVAGIENHHPVRTVEFTDKLFDQAAHSFAIQVGARNHVPARFVESLSDGCCIAHCGFSGGGIAIGAVPDDQRKIIGQRAASQAERQNCGG